jgi:hypothetical protein
MSHGMTNQRAEARTCARTHARTRLKRAAVGGKHRGCRAARIALTTRAALRQRGRWRVVSDGLACDRRSHRDVLRSGRSAWHRLGYCPLRQ